MSDEVDNVLNDDCNISDTGDAFEIVMKYSKEYGRDVLRTQFPHVSTGLRLGHMRSIWVLRDTTTPTKSEQVISRVADLHNHNTGSIYQSIARLAQPFVFTPTIFAGDHSSFGKYEDPKPGAARYTKLYLNAAGRALFFDGIDKNSIPMMPGSDYNTKEPDYLIPAIPTALCIPNNTIGWAIGSLTLGRNFNDICELASAYCLHRRDYDVFKKFDISKYAHLILPDYAIPNRVINHKDLLQKYKEGDENATVQLSGSVIISANRIRITSLPFGTELPKVKEILNSIRRADKSESHWLFSLIDDRVEVYSAKNDIPSCVDINLKRGVDPFMAWEKIKPLIKFTINVKPRPVFTDSSGIVTQMGISDLLYFWYESRYNLLVSSKRKYIRQIQIEIMQIAANLIAVENREEVSNILSANGATTSDVKRALVNRFPLSVQQAEYLIESKLRTLIAQEADELRNKLDKLKIRMKELSESINNVATEMSNTALELKRRFNSPRITALPNYIGYVSVGKGCIQIESTDEVDGILESFPKSPVTVHMYDGPNLIQVDANGKFVSGSIPKYTTGDIYGFPFAESDAYTVNFNSEKGTICCVKGIVPGTRDAGFTYTSKKSIIIRRTGKIETVNVPDVIALRKSIGQGNISDIIYVYPHIGGSHFIIIANDETPNVITIRRVKGKDGPTILPLPPNGNLKILHHPTGKDWYITLPSNYLNRVNTRGFKLNANELLGDMDTMKIDVLQTKWKKHKHFRALT